MALPPPGPQPPRRMPPQPVPGLPPKPLGGPGVPGLGNSDQIQALGGVPPLPSADGGPRGVPPPPPVPGLPQTPEGGPGGVGSGGYRPPVPLPGPPSGPEGGPGGRTGTGIPTRGSGPFVPPANLPQPPAPIPPVAPPLDKNAAFQARRKKAMEQSRIKHPNWGQPGFPGGPVPAPGPTEIAGGRLTRGKQRKRFPAPPPAPVPTPVPQPPPRRPPPRGRDNDGY